MSIAAFLIEPVPGEESGKGGNRFFYRADDETDIKTLSEWQKVPGAMWDATWYPTKGLDGLALMVICPGGGFWFIDGRASNCTKPDDNEHRCWVRHGEPPNITVDKEGNTCNAGAGSIGVQGYHGFLRNGVFT